MAILIKLHLKNVINFKNMNFKSQAAFAVKGYYFYQGHIFVLNHTDVIFFIKVFESVHVQFLLFGILFNDFLLFLSIFGE